MTHARGRYESEVYILESILTSVKKLLGITEEQTAFDSDIIMGINASLNALTQIGVGPENGFIISDSSAIWSDFIGEEKRLELVKTYVYLKTRLVFDPPQSSSVMDAINKSLQEIEWRINSVVDF